MSALVRGGHDMVSGSLGFLGAGALVGAAGLVPKFEKIAGAASAIAGVLFAIAAIGFTAGVFLAYILPLMPFIYFCFAVIGWVLEIFEAIIAMPLWALAHLRIEGDGLAGPGALSGYQLLFMILIRPALIVVGLVAGYLLFGASAYFFGSLFNSATVITQQDLTGGVTGGVANLVYTIVFVFLIYNLATMCFKMIDDVPKGILRWMGIGVQPFSDSRGDPIQGSREMVIGTVAAGATLGRAVQQVPGGIAKTVSSFKKEDDDTDNDKSKGDGSGDKDSKK